MREATGRSIRKRGCPFLGTVAMFAGLVLSGCSSRPESEPAPVVTVEVAVADRQPIERVVSADAILYPREQAAIVPKISAPVKRFYVDRGSRVHRGQLLAELEDKDLVGTVTENQGGYQQAEAAYQTATQKAAQDLLLAKQQLDAQQKIYDSRQALYQQGAVSAKEVTDSRIALTQAQGQYDAARKMFDLKSAEGQLTAAQGKKASATAQLSYARIVSPISGVVTDRPLFQGETASSTTPLLTVMDLSQVIARTHISQEEAATLNVGDKAAIVVPGESDEFPGKVTLVSPALDPNSTTLEIWVQAANRKERLKPGTSVRLEIVSKRVPDAIVIPAAALLTAPDGATSVFTLDSSSKPHRQSVKVGIRNGDQAQITEGVKEGDRVVVAGAFDLDKEDENILAKTKIQIETPKPPSSDKE